uniref:Cytochrome P450 n=1 Tax=Brassica oleracea var. oleracea TaxID=109376 RepID=A0A0D3DAZ4_BRAOL
MGNHMVSKNNFEPPKINAEIQRLSEWAKDSLAETVRHMSWFTICVLNPHFISYSPLISLVIGLVAEETNYFSETEKHPMDKNYSSFGVFDWSKFRYFTRVRTRLCLNLSKLIFIALNDTVSLYEWTLTYVSVVRKPFKFNNHQKQNTKERTTKTMSIILYFFSFLLFSLIFVKKIKESKQNLPPSPPKFPIIGNLHQLRGLLHRCLHDISKEHGPVLLLKLGFIQMAVISSSEAAEEALKTHDLECCTRPKTNTSSTFSRDGTNIAFGPYGEAWRELRKLSVLYFFSVKKVRSFRSWLKGSLQWIEENKHVDKERIKELMFEVQRTASLSSSDLLPAGLGWFLYYLSGQHRRVNQVFVEVDTLLNHIIDDHLKNPEDKTNKDRPDIVDSILDIMHKQEQDESFKLNFDNLKGIMQDIYLGGVDTSAITMIWAMAELVRNPRVMKKAQDEIRTCFGIKQKERIEEEDLDKLQYLKLVIKETLRLHPAGPLLLPRETMSQIKIQGYDIPPKTLLVVNAWSIGRDPKHWEDPEEFIPERFIDCPVDYKGQSFEMLPFGSGRRMCPGMASAIATVELGLLNLLYYFDWRLPEEEKILDMEEAGDTTVIKKVPLELLPVLHE